ncbi:unnamed protein product, partial [Trichogramma brassicae]
MRFYKRALETGKIEDVSRKSLYRGKKKKDKFLGPSTTFFRTHKGIYVITHMVNRMSTHAPQYRSAQREQGNITPGPANDIYVFSVYAPPRLTDEEFSALLANVTEEAQGKRPLVLAGDFNAWSMEWGCSETRARGTALMDSLAPLDVVLLNTGNTPTFVGPNGQSIIDVTFVSDTLAPRTTSWQVSKLYTHSDHQALLFGIRDARPPGPAPHRSCRWNSRSLNEMSFTTMMAGAEITQRSAEEMAAELMSAITGACDASMARVTGRGRHGPVYWWTDGISDLRRACMRARRLAQRARGRPNEDARRADFTTARHRLRAAIRASKRQCWSRLCEEVDHDAWGRPYETVMSRLRGPRARPPSSATLVRRAVAALFPVAAEVLSPPPSPSGDAA